MVMPYDPDATFMVRVVVEEEQPIVIDCGQYSCKLGGTKDYIEEFPSLVGTRKERARPSNINRREYFVGRDVENRRGILKVLCPIERGLITHNDRMEMIWRHVMGNTERSEHPVVLTEAPLNPKYTREFMTRTMFEIFEVPALYIAAQPVCALISNGKTSGTVLDSGDGVTHSASIFEGILMPHTVCKLDFGGDDLTNLVNDTLFVGKDFFSSGRSKEISRRIKEKLCYVSLNYRQDMDGPPVEELFELPDETTITIGKDLFGMVEPLFNPRLLDMDTYGLHEMIFQSISKCDLDLKKEMYNNIVIAGGNTKFRGFTKRLTLELNEMVPSMIDVDISDTPEREYSIYRGAIMLGEHLMSMSKFASNGIVESFSSKCSSMDLQLFTENVFS